MSSKRLSGVNCYNIHMLGMYSISSKHLQGLIITRPNSEKGLFKGGEHLPSLAESQIANWQIECHLIPITPCIRTWQRMDGHAVSHSFSMAERCILLLLLLYTSEPTIISTSNKINSQMKYPHINIHTIHHQ